MASRGFVVINDNMEKYEKVKRAVIIGVLIIVAIIGWHFYQNSANKINKNELGELAEKLYALELKNQPYKFHINLQCKIEISSADDCSLNPLFEKDTNVTENENSTIALMTKLYEYYNYDVSVPENVNQQKQQEELKFLNAILKTPIMTETMKFLEQKDFKVNNREEQLKLIQDIWFTPYSRGKGPDGSTGFEHVFLAEIRKNKTLGFHNWVYLLEQEKLGHVNYHGYLKHIDMGKHNLHLLSLRFDFHDKIKKFNTILIGASAELEMSLYTVCFLLNENKSCPIELGSTRFSIMTYKIFDSHHKKTLGSAFVSSDD